MIDCYSLATYILNIKRVELGLTQRYVCRCMEQNRFDTKMLYTTYITYCNDDDDDDDFDDDDDAVMITLVMMAMIKITVD